MMGIDKIMNDQHTPRGNNTTEQLRVPRREFLQRSTGGAALLSSGVLAASAFASGAPKAKLKVGQIGCGHAHAAGKMAAFRNSPDWEVVGVVEDDPQVRAEAEQEEEYRDLTWMTAEQLLDTPGLKLVAVETKVAQLLETAEACIDAGFSIHLDKPPGESLDRFRQLLAEADRRQLVVQMGYMYRYNPGIVLLQDLLTKGCLGEIFELHGVMGKVIGKDKRQAWAEFSGGTLFELGCHLIDLLIGILGKPDQIATFHRRSGMFGDTLLDNALAVCQYPHATATIRSAAIEVEGFARRHLTVCGTQGTLHIQPLDNPSAMLALAKDCGKYKSGYHSITLPKYERYIDDVADLAAVLRGEKQNDFPTSHDLAAQATLLEACEMDKS